MVIQLSHFPTLPEQIWEELFYFVQILKAQISAEPT